MDPRMRERTDGMMAYERSSFPSSSAAHSYRPDRYPEYAHDAPYGAPTRHGNQPYPPARDGYRMTSQQQQEYVAGYDQRERYAPPASRYAHEGSNRYAVPPERNSGYLDRHFSGHSLTSHTSHSSGASGDFHGPSPADRPPFRGGRDAWDDRDARHAYAAPDSYPAGQRNGGASYYSQPPPRGSYGGGRDVYPDFDAAGDRRPRTRPETDMPGFGGEQAARDSRSDDVAVKSPFVFPTSGPLFLPLDRIPPARSEDVAGLPMSRSNQSMLDPDGWNWVKGIIDTN